MAAISAWVSGFCSTRTEDVVHDCMCCGRCSAAYAQASRSTHPHVLNHAAWFHAAAHGLVGGVWPGVSIFTCTLGLEPQPALPHSAARGLQGMLGWWGKLWAVTSWWSLCGGPSSQALLPSSRLPPLLVIHFFRAST